MADTLMSPIEEPQRNFHAVGTISLTALAFEMLLALSAVLFNAQGKEADYKELTVDPAGGATGKNNFSIVFEEDVINGTVSGSTNSERSQIAGERALHLVDPRFEVPSVTLYPGGFIRTRSGGKIHPALP